VLRAHFLNVGHGDCTIIKHPSGRLTMIDCNSSSDYDSESFNELMTERRDHDALAAALSAFSPASNPLMAPSPFEPGLAPFLPASNPLMLPSQFPPTSNPIALVPPSSLAPGFLGEYFGAMQAAKDELTDPIDFMRRVYPGEKLFRFVLTHPDLDHMRGIKRVYETIGFTNFWDTAHTKPTPDFKSDDDEEDWAFYQQLRTGTTKRYHRGDRLFAFGADERGGNGDGVEIMSPTPQLVTSCNAAEKSNDLSYVLRIWHAGRSLLLPGDAEEEAWDSMRIAYGARLKSDILKASHHGRDSGYDLAALRLIAPSAVVVSVGRKPPTDASRKYHANCGWVASTRYYGNIELRMHDNGTWEWFAQRNSDAP